MITQPASIGLQLLGTFFCFVGGGLFLDGLFGGEMAWGWGFLWLPFGVWLCLRGGKGQRERIAKRDARHSLRVQVLTPVADTGSSPDEETQPGVIPRRTRDRVHAAARAAAQHGRRDGGGRRKG